MSDPLPMFVQMTLWDLPINTSSLGLVDGPWRSGSQDGQTTSQSLQVQPPANPSQVPANAKVRKTKDTSGLSFSDLLNSADLVLSSVSRSLQRMASAGSTEYSLTLKVRVTPAGRVIPALRASALRTSGSDCTGWPTCQTADAKDCANETANRKPGAKGWNAGMTLLDAMRICITGWPTPNIPNRGTGSRESKDGRGAGGIDLQSTAMLTGWNTPRATDGSNGGPNQTGGALPADAALAGWATPAARGFKSESVTAEFNAERDAHSRGKPLSYEVLQAAGWATPNTVDAQGRPWGMSGGKEVLYLPGMAGQGKIPGEIPSSSPAETGKPGVLDAAFGRWLMGFPEAWDLASPNYADWRRVQEAIASDGCEGMAMQSFQR